MARLLALSAEDYQRRLIIQKFPRIKWRLKREVASLFTG